MEKFWELIVMLDKKCKEAAALSTSDRVSAIADSGYAIACSGDASKVEEVRSLLREITSLTRDASKPVSVSYSYKMVGVIKTSRVF